MTVGGGFGPKTTLRLETFRPWYPIRSERPWDCTASASLKTNFWPCSSSCQIRYPSSSSQIRYPFWPLCRQTCRPPCQPPCPPLCRPPCAWLTSKIRLQKHFNLRKVFTFLCAILTLILIYQERVAVAITKPLTPDSTPKFWKKYGYSIFYYRYWHGKPFKNPTLIACQMPGLLKFWRRDLNSVSIDVM